MKNSEEIISNDNNESKFGRMLIDWLKSMSRFYVSYNELVCYRSDITQKQKYIGQCPVKHVQLSIISMQNDLGKLLVDFDSVTSRQGGYKQLAKHTVRLNYLTDQCQLLLYLASLPTS